MRKSGFFIVFFLMANAVCVMAQCNMLIKYSLDEKLTDVRARLSLVSPDGKNCVLLKIQQGAPIGNIVWNNLANIGLRHLFIAINTAAIRWREVSGLGAMNWRLLRI